MGKARRSLGNNYNKERSETQGTIRAAAHPANYRQDISAGTVNFSSQDHLRTAGGVMAGPIGYINELIAVVSGELDLVINPASKAIKVRHDVYPFPESGLTDTIDTISCDDQEMIGQRLLLKGLDTYTFTLTHDSTPSGDKKAIHCPGDIDYLLTNDEAVELMWDAAGFWTIIGGAGGGSAGVQTPWLSDIDGGTNSLSNVTNISMLGDITSVQTGIFLINTINTTATPAQGTVITNYQSQGQDSDGGAAVSYSRMLQMVRDDTAGAYAGEILFQVSTPTVVLDGALTMFGDLNQVWVGPDWDLDLNNGNIIAVDDITAARFDPSAASYTATNPGLRRGNNDEVYLDGLTTGHVDIRVNGRGPEASLLDSSNPYFRFTSPAVTDVIFKIFNDKVAGSETSIRFGGDETDRGEISHFKEGLFIINNLSAGAGDGVVIQQESVRGMKVASTGITMNDDLIMANGTDVLNLTGAEIDGFTKLNSLTPTTLNIELTSKAIVLDANVTAPSSTSGTVEMRLEGTTRVTLGWDGSPGDERLLLTGAYLDMNNNVLANVDIISNTAEVPIRMTDQVFIHALTGFVGYQTGSTAVTTMDDAANVGVMQIPYKADDDETPTDGELDTWFGDQNGCMGVQRRATATTFVRLWIQAAGSWFSTDLT